MMPTTFLDFIDDRDARQVVCLERLDHRADVVVRRNGRGLTVHDVGNGRHGTRVYSSRGRRPEPGTMADGIAWHHVTGDHAFGRAAPAGGDAAGPGVATDRSAGGLERIEPAGQEGAADARQHVSRSRPWPVRVQTGR